jgi:hypothetical protein
MGLDELPFERRLWERPFSGEDLFRDRLPADPLGPASREDLPADEEPTEGPPADQAGLVAATQHEPDAPARELEPDALARVSNSRDAVPSLALRACGDRRAGSLPAVLSVALGVLGAWLREQTQRWALCETVGPEKRRKTR